MKEANPTDVFTRLNGVVYMDNRPGSWPAFISSPKKTPGGQAYFTRPGVILLAQPQFNKTAIDPFLLAFPDDLGFKEYAHDETIENGANLIKTAGQLCY